MQHEGDLRAKEPFTFSHRPPLDGTFDAQATFFTANYLGYGTIPVVYRDWVRGWYTNPMFSLQWYYYPITKQ